MILPDDLKAVAKAREWLDEFIAKCVAAGHDKDLLSTMAALRDEGDGFADQLRALDDHQLRNIGVWAGLAICESWIRVANGPHLRCASVDHGTEEAARQRLSLPTI
jgi:hypothetical protein